MKADEAHQPQRRRIRAPGAAVLTLVLLVFAVLVLAPTVGAYLDQQQQIADLKAKVAGQEADLSALKAEQARWSDPAYVRAQASSRLFYVLPGERTYRVVGGTATSSTKADAPTTKAHVADTDWASALVGSLVEAGTSNAAPSALPQALPSAAAK